MHNPNTMFDSRLTNDEALFKRRHVEAYAAEEDAADLERCVNCGAP